MDLSLSEEEKNYWAEVEYYLEQIYDNLDIYVYGKKINYREYQKRYYNATSNWMINVVKSTLNKEAITMEDFENRISKENLSELIHISEFYSDVIPFSKCKEIYEIMLTTHQYPWEIVCEMGLLDSNDLDINQIVLDAIKENPVQYEKYRGGNKNMKNYFVGVISKAYKNKLTINAINEALEIILNQ